MSKCEEGSEPKCMESEYKGTGKNEVCDVQFRSRLPVLKHRQDILHIKREFARKLPFYWPPLPPENPPPLYLTSEGRLTSICPPDPMCFGGVETFLLNLRHADMCTGQPYFLHGRGFLMTSGGIPK